MGVWDFFIIGGSPDVVSVTPDAPFETIEELAEAAAANQESIDAGARASGPIHHLNLLAFEKAIDGKFNFVPYDSSAASQNAGMTGEVTVVVTSVAEQAIGFAVPMDVPAFDTAMESDVVQDWLSFNYYVASGVTGISVFRTGLTAAAFPVIVIAMAAVAFVATLGIPYGKRGSVIEAGFRGDVGYLGLAMVGTIIGPEALGTSAIIIAVGALVYAVLSILVLSVMKSGPSPMRPLSWLVSIVTNPMVLAIVLGMVFSINGWKVPAVLNGPLGLLARMSLPLILLVLGLSLSFSELQRNVLYATLASVLKLAIMPFLAWVVMECLLPGPKFVVHTTVIMAAMPTAVASQTFAKVFEADESVSVSSVSLSTLLSMVSVPVVVLALGV